MVELSAGLGVESNGRDFAIIPILNHITLALGGKFTESDGFIFPREEQHEHSVRFENVCFGDSIHFQITGLHFGGLCVGFQHDWVPVAWVSECIISQRQRKSMTMLAVWDFTRSRNVAIVQKFPSLQRA